jgi:hypothetical protein
LSPVATAPDINPNDEPLASSATHHAGTLTRNIFFGTIRFAAIHSIDIAGSSSPQLSLVIASRTKETLNCFGTNQITTRSARAATRSNALAMKAASVMRDALEVLKPNLSGSGKKFY